MAGKTYLVEHDALVAALDARAEHVKASFLSGSGFSAERWGRYQTALERITAHPLPPGVTKGLAEAAPDLLDACESALAVFETMPDGGLCITRDIYIDKLKAAIAKARGAE